MTTKSMDIALHPDGTPRMTYEPRPSANFIPVDIPIPHLRKMRWSAEDVMRPDLAAEKPTDEISFRDHATKRVRECCGNAVCSATVHLAVSDQLNGPDSRIVTGATINCKAFNCPLIDPPSSGDREPLTPAPQPPTLQASIELPL